ncbi:hypothetical protein [Streptomyces sp. ISL-66]|uniref:hypothetical protein n=1 Tax=Streptomyces sp. ISL-66 TaxID=2819186 RepID=UPI002035BD36|nr:hypothetical protein [Streptomyces sp. ISL-66]
MTAMVSSACLLVAGSAFEHVGPHARLEGDHGHVVGDDVVQLARDADPFLGDRLLGTRLLLPAQLRGQFGELPVAFGESRGPTPDEAGDRREDHRLSQDRRHGAVFQVAQSGEHPCPRDGRRAGGCD